MTITSVSNIIVSNGSGSSVDNQTSLIGTISNTTATNRFIILAVVTDNIASGGGDDGAVTGVTITQASKATTTLTKVAQVANNVAAQGGVSLSIWYAPFADAYTGNVAVCTATFGSASLVDASAMTGHMFGYDTTKTLAVEAMATPLVNDTSSSADGSMSLSSMPATNRVRYRAIGVQIGTSQTITVTNGFTATLGSQSATSGTTGEVTVRGEFLVNVAANGTSDPTLSFSGINVSQFIAIYEITPTGALAVTEGPDVAAFVMPDPYWSTALAVTEGPDTVAVDAISTAFNALAVTEGPDAVLFNVFTLGGANNANLVVTEGPDVAAFEALYMWPVILDVTEEGDTVIFDGVTREDPPPPTMVTEVWRFGRPYTRSRW